MATPTASKNAPDDDSESGQQLSRAEQDLNTKLISGFNESLRGYAAPKEHAEADTLQNRYRIILSSPLPEYNSTHAAAYAATDSMAPGKKLMGLVCNPKIVQRTRVIKTILPVEHRAILPLLASGNVELSTTLEERFVIFYEKPSGKKLSELVAQKRIPLNHQFICEHILAPLISALEEFSILGISHGMINADNIYFDERAIIGPCVAEPCGLSQTFYYESIERMQAMLSAKGEGSVSQDYYALAVLALYIIHGPEHFTGFTPDILMMLILNEGAYNALMRGKDVPEIFYDFFRGTLTQSVADRWNERQLKSWVEGKRYNVLQPPPPKDAMRPFEFGEHSVTTRRELAHLCSKDWERMILMMQNRQLTHWVAVSLRNKELSDAIGRMGRSVIELSSKNEAQTHELLMNIILLLDPEGPIRIKHISMHIDGMDSMYADMYATSAHQDLQFIAHFIETSLATQWLNLEKTIDPLFEPSESVNAIIMKLERLRSYVRNSGFGFGLERILYDLNPNMPCISPLFGNRYITSLPALLRQLDRMTGTLSGDEMIDRHIAAFIASKLSITHEIRLQDNIALPGIASNRTVLALYLLSLVQSKFDNLKLPGLTLWLTIRMMPLIDTIHSYTLRHKLKNQLSRIGSLGYTQKLAELIIGSEFLIADAKGYMEAMSQYRINAFEILSLQTPERLERESQKMGLFIATFMAYGLFLVSLLIIMNGIMS